MGFAACTLEQKTCTKLPIDYEYQQLSFINFNASCGMQLDCENEWSKRASQLPWKAWETLYTALFPSDIGNVAKPCRIVLGSLIIQLYMGLSDRDLVRQIQENLYYQYFIGLERTPCVYKIQEAIQRLYPDCGSAATWIYPQKSALSGYVYARWLCTG